MPFGSAHSVEWPAESGSTGASASEKCEEPQDCIAAAGEQNRRPAGRCGIMEWRARRSEFKPEVGFTAWDSAFTREVRARGGSWICPLLIDGDQGLIRVDWRCWGFQ